MRLVLCALAALAATPAVAQSQYAAGRGGFVSLNQFAASSPGGLQNADATVGVRVGDRVGGGVDAGLRVGVVRSGVGRQLSAGPVAGVSRPLGRGWTGRAEGALRAEASSGTVAALTLADGTVRPGTSYDSRTLTGDVTASVSRSVRVSGSFHVRPTLGLYAAATQRLRGDAPAPGTLARSSAGLHVELPLTFRLFQQDVAVVSSGRIALTGGDDHNPLFSTGTYAGGGLRLNF